MQHCAHGGENCEDGRHGGADRPRLSVTFSIEAARPVQHVVATKTSEEDVVKNDSTRSNLIPWSCGLLGGLTRVPHKETRAEREQREKEEWEKRLAQKAKRDKGEKERKRRARE